MPESILRHIEGFSGKVASTLPENRTNVVQSQGDEAPFS